ncbi:MAG: hypothetical protein QOC57_1540 [Ilumatobacteraceae bacterium]
MNSAFISTSSESPAVERSTAKGRYVRAGLVAGVVAGAATSAIAGVMALFDVKLEAQGKGFPALAFAQVSLFGAILGVGLAAVLSRRARRPRHTFVVTTIVLTVLSFVPPLLIGAGAATVLILELMHVVAAAIVIPTIATRLAE